MARATAEKLPMTETARPAGPNRLLVFRVNGERVRMLVPAGDSHDVPAMIASTGELPHRARRIETEIGIAPAGRTARSTVGGRYQGVVQRFSRSAGSNGALLITAGA